MNLAVLKYQFVAEKPTGIPDAWPAYVVELGESTDLPGQDWVLMTGSEFETYKANNQAAYDAWFAAYSPYSPSEVVQSKIMSAMSFGQSMMVQFATENVLMGITQAGMTAAVSDYLGKLQNYILNGSLYAAINEIDLKIADPDLETNYAPFLTVARLTEYKQKIQTFLGI